MERERDREDTKSNMLDELWVEEGEPGKLILVKVHHEELVRGCQLRALAGKLSVKVRDVFSMPLRLAKTTTALKHRILGWQS